MHQTDSLCENLLETFRLANARLSQFTVLERRSFSGPGSGSTILARAIRADQAFSGDVTDAVWQFTIRADSLVGELRLSDGTRVRDVRTQRSR